MMKGQQENGKMTHSIGIIGGTGKMGRLFARVFADAGFCVMVSGRNTPLTSLDIAQKADVVMISVPIHATVTVIREVAPLLGKKQILCDLTSLKVLPVEAMLSSKAEVIGFHPMFGPSVSGLTGQTIIVTPARCQPASCDLLTGVFLAEGARITYATPDEHDRLMAVIQGLTHFKSLVMAETLRRLQIKPEMTRSFTSPVYQIEMNIAGRLLAQDKTLYGDILTQNPYIPDVLDTCFHAVSDIRKTITDTDLDGFFSLFDMNQEWFGPFCASAMEESDRVIRSMTRDGDA